MKSRNENLTLHILAALLALVLWSFVKTADLPTRADSSQTFVNMPLEVRDVPSGLLITNQLPATVSVTLRGSGAVLEQATRDQLVVYVSLEQAAEGVAQTAVKVSHPEGLTATPSPARVEVRLEQVLTADFTVKPLIIGGSEDRYADVSISPAIIKVTGVRSQVTAASQAVVLVDLQGINTGDKLDLQLPVKLRDAAGQELTQLVVEPGTVRTSVQVLPGKRVAVKPIFQGEVAQGYELDGWELEQASVIVYGPAAILESLQSIETGAIDLTGISSNTTVTAQLALPAGTISAQPAQVQLALLVKRNG